MAEVVSSRKPVAVSPLKVSQAMGASLAFLGLDRAMPLEHSARGCTALSKLFFMRHFREPIALQTTAMEQLTPILGADENLVEALHTVCVKDRPAIIGVISTGLSETQGADISYGVQVFRTAYPEFDDVPIIPVSAPDTPGCLDTGFANAIEAMVDAFVPSRSSTARLPRQVNVLASPMLTTGDVEILKHWIEAFGLHPILLPDLASSLDGHLIEAGYSSVTYGGATRASLATLCDSAATIVIGASLGQAADLLKARTGIPDYRFTGLMGLGACDALTDALSLIAGKPVPERIERCRSQLLDAMVDCHFVIGHARIAVAADPDLLGQLIDFLVGMGADISAAVASARTSSLADLPIMRIVVGDLEDLEDEAGAAGVDLVIANSHAARTADRLAAPLLRAGFPQYDWFGGHAKTWVGYQGSRQVLFDIANMLSASRRPIAPYHSSYRLSSTECAVTEPPARNHASIKGVR